MEISEPELSQEKVKDIISLGSVSYQSLAFGVKAKPSPIGVSLSSPAKATNRVSLAVAIAETPPAGKTFVIELGLLKISTIESLVD